MQIDLPTLIVAIVGLLIGALGIRYFRRSLIGPRLVLEAMPPDPALPYFKTIESAGKDKPWLVMVHGASQHQGVFSAQLASFQSRYRLLLIDLPGHGGSAGLPGPYGLVEYAERVGAVLEHLSVGEMHFWGTHTGAGVGLLLATGAHGARVKSLILDGAVLPGVDLSSVTSNASRAKATARAQGIEAARREWFDQAGWFEVMRRNPERCRAREHWQMVSEFAGGPWLDVSEPAAVPSIEALLSRVDAPVLLINGEHDLADFQMIAKRIANALPNAEQFSVPGGGGFPLWEFPREVNGHVAAFLDRLEANEPA